MLLLLGLGLETKIMNIRSFLSLAVTFGGVLPVQCFQLRSLALLASPIRKGTTRFANERDGLIPETSFGAEVVPEGQRPVNEYLEMRRSPLFEWASNDVGTQGVSPRLYIVARHDETRETSPG